MATTAEIREQVIEFAATFPTPNVRLAVQLAEAGTVTWEQVAGLFKVALVAAVAEVDA